MPKNVLAVCQSCAETNGGSWKNPRNTAPVFMTQCQCCKEIKPCTHIQYWKGITSETDMVDPMAEIKAEVAQDAEKAAKKAEEDAKKKENAGNNGGNKPKGNVLGNQ